MGWQGVFWLLRILKRMCANGYSYGRCGFSNKNLLECGEYDSDDYRKQNGCDGNGDGGNNKPEFKVEFWRGCTDGNVEGRARCCCGGDGDGCFVVL